MGVEMKKLASAAVAALALLAPSARAADFPEGFRNRFQLELSGAWDNFDTEARLDVTRNGIVSVGTTVDFEELLNVPNEKSHFRLAGQWRFSRVSYVQFSWESIARSGSRIADRDIAWGDTTYHLGARLDGAFDSDEAYLGYRYDMFRADNVLVGGTVGFAYWAVDSSLAGTGTVTKPDGTTETATGEKSLDVKAPVPVVGLAVDGAISSKVTFGFYLRALFLNVEDFSGGTLSGGMSAKWYFSKNLGAGAGVDLRTIRIKEYREDDKTFYANYTIAGPRVFVAASF